MIDENNPTRQAHSDELPEVVDLWLAMMHEHEAFEPDLGLAPKAGPAYHSFLLMGIGNPRARIYVVDGDEGICGFCVAFIMANLPMFQPEEFGFIYDIYLKPSCRGLGLGKNLLENAYQWFREEGIGTVHLQVYTKNTKGRSFWEQAGYNPLVVRMWRDLEA